MNFLPFSLDWKQYLPFASTGTREVHDSWRTSDGTKVTLRGARANDGELIQQLVRGLSLQSRYQRFFYPLHELPPDMLARFTDNVPTEAITLLATMREHGSGRDVAIAMAQYVADDYPAHCDFAVVVADQWQGKGVGKRLVQALMCIARAAGIERMQGDILAENERMRRLMVRMDFQLQQHADGAYLRKASKALGVPEWKCSPLTALAAQARHGVRANIHA